MNQKIPMTKQGADQIQKELEHLKSVKRPEIIQAIAEAREHGDLKENAEYHAAREEQGMTEARINDLEYKLSLAQVIDVKSLQQNGKVVFSTTVVLEDIDSGDELTYKIVGEDESNIKSGLLAFNTPIAKALIGNDEGDTVEIDVPSGRKTYEIVEVRYE